MGTRDRFQRVDELFRAALRLDPDDRDDYLDQQCGEDHALRSEVVSLLSRDEGATGGLDRPVLGEELRLSEIGGAKPPRPDRVPERIGQYRIVSRIGVGGMGVVFEAEQDRPRRTVALKVINVGVGSPTTLRRFEYEAQILGKLQHPGIAQIFEAGTFDTGAGARPFFAMELIRGKPVLEHARLEDLSTRQRLELMIPICEAVQHAHQRGIIHRDLKPANILVDESGHAKILDFGVARATDGDIQTTTLRTDVGQLIGTVPYMSPEQAAGDPDELDTRSDVYALGVVTYELLTGRLPYDVKKKMVHEAVRMIREEDPVPLSTVNRTLKGDVETVVGMALEKDKSRRYQSAQALADDIRRVLDDEPIAARPPTTWYQMRKFARRHTALVSAAVVVLLVLVAGIIVTSTALARALVAEDQARQEARTAERVTDFLVELFEVSDPGEARGNTITAREILDRGAERIREELADEPVVRARLMSIMGSVYLNLGLLEPAEPLLQEALRTRQALVGEDDLLVAGTLTQVGEVLLERGRFDEAERAMRQAVEIRRRHLGPDHPEFADALSYLAGLQATVGDYDGAEGTLRQTLLIRRGLAEEDPEALASNLHNLAGLLVSKGKPREAVPHFEEALELYRTTGETDHPRYAFLGSGFGLALRELGELERAEEVLREALQRTRAIFGERNANVAPVAGNLALVLQDQKKYDEAELLFRLVLEIDRGEFGASHPYVATDLDNLAVLLHDKEDLDAAEPLYRESLEMRRRVLPEDHPDLAFSLNNLAMLLEDRGRIDEAERIFEECIALRRRILDADHPHLAHSLSNLGQMLITVDRYEDAEPNLLEAHRIYVAAYDEDHRRARLIARSLVELYEKWDRPDEAESWRGFTGEE